MQREGDSPSHSWVELPDRLGHDVVSTDDGEPPVSPFHNHSPADDSQVTSATEYFKSDHFTPESAMLQEEHPATSFDPPKRRWRVWWILGLYLPLLIVPWALTCVMAYRPVSAPSYIDHAGKLTPSDFEVNESWLVVIDIMNTIAAVLTVPVTSLMLAEAAVLWLQRGEEREPFVSLAHFFDIADRGWTDPAIVYREILRDNTQPYFATRNWFLLCAAALVMLCSIFYPLRQLLVRIESIQVPTCEDIPLGADGVPSCLGNPDVIARDGQPGMMQLLPLRDVVEQVQAHLAVDTDEEAQTRLWTIERTASDSSEQQILSHYSADRWDNTLDPWWISAVPNGTTTGILRQHVMRMDNSISCERIAFDTIPKTCPGPRPFTTEYTDNLPDMTNIYRPSDDDFSNGSDPGYRMRVCVPGSFIQSPWNRSRDAITIEEEIFLGLEFLDPRSKAYVEGEPFAMHCNARTTRGYFELGNIFNGNVPQPLLDRFPQHTDSSDISGIHNDEGIGFVPMGPIDNGAYDNDGAVEIAPGPLAISAVALFGNASFFGASKIGLETSTITAAADVCRMVAIPLLSADPLDFYGVNLDLVGPICDIVLKAANGTSDKEMAKNAGFFLTKQVTQWLSVFGDPTIARRAFGIAAFYASEALLTQAANDEFDSRDIYSSDGHTTQKLSAALASIIALSIILAVEILCLLFLAIYIWKEPTWTSTFNSLTVALLANAVPSGILPPTGCHDENALQVLHRMDGRIGVAAVKTGEDGAVVQRLVHGGPDTLSLAHG